MLNDLMLLSGIDIPFPQAQITIHQPRIKEISFIGEETFFLGCEILNFSKDLLGTEDKSNLENKTNFEVLMSIMRDNKNPAVQKNRICATMVLTLIFPDCKIHFNKDHIDIASEGDLTDIHKITNDNFEAFKEIIAEMFCLKHDLGNGPVYNPGGDRAAAIAAKLNKGRAKAAQSKGEKTKISIISRYMSILAVGNQQSFDSLNEYTVYQLFDKFNRYEMKNNFDIYLSAKLAGAKDLEEVDNWMKDIHS